MRDDDLIELALAGPPDHPQRTGKGVRDRGAKSPPADDPGRGKKTQPVRDPGPLGRAVDRSDLGARQWAGSGPLSGRRPRVIPLVVAAAVTAAGLGLALAGGPESPPAYLAGGWLLAAGGVGAGFLAAVRRRGRGRLEIAAYDYGLVYSADGRARTVRWPEIASVTEEGPTTAAAGRGAAGRRHVIRFRCADGSRHRLDVGAMAESAGLSVAVHAGTLPHLMPLTVGAVAAGRPVRFGRLALTTRGLAHGRRTLPWAEVAAVEVENDILVVRRAGADELWYAAACGSTPDVQVLLNVVRTRALTPGPSAGRNWAAEASRYSLLDMYRPAAGSRRRGS